MALFSETDEKAWKDKYDAFRGRGKCKLICCLYVYGVQLSQFLLLKKQMPQLKVARVGVCECYSFKKRSYRLCSLPCYRNISALLMARISARATKDVVVSTISSSMMDHCRLGSIC